MKKILTFIVLFVIFNDVSFAESVAKLRCKDPNSIDQSVKIDLINMSIKYGTSPHKFKIIRITDERIISEAFEPFDGYRRTISFDRYSGELAFTSYHKDPPHIFFSQCRKLDPSKKIF